MLYDRKALSALLRPFRNTDHFALFGIAKGPISYTQEKHYLLEKEEIAIKYLPNTAGAPPPFFADYLSQIEKESTPFVADLEGGIATWDGAHLNQSGELIAELTHQFGKEATDHRLFAPRSLRWRPKIEQIEGSVVSLAGRSSDNYFHWLWDLLPRIDLVREKADFYYIDHSKPWQQALLRRIGISADQVICVQRHPRIQARRLLVPSYPALCPWVRRFFEKSFPVKTSKRRSFYISRADANWRYVVNEEEVVRALGLESIELSQLSVDEQIELFQSAELIVTPHGAGLANLAFCKPGTRVVEIFAENFIRHDYWSQCELMGLHYTYLQGEPTGRPPHRKGAAYDDVKIPITELQSSLACWEQR